MFLGQEEAREEGSPKSGTTLTSVCCLPLGPSLTVGVKGEGSGPQTQIDTAPQMPVFRDGFVLGNRGGKSRVKFLLSRVP